MSNTTLNTTVAKTPEALKAEALANAKHLHHTTAYAVDTALEIGGVGARSLISSTVDYYLVEAASVLNGLCEDLDTTVMDLMTDDPEFFDALDLDVVSGVFSGGLLDYSSGRAFVDCLDLDLDGISITAAPHPTGKYTASACTPDGAYITASNEQFFISFTNLENYIKARYGLELVINARDLFGNGENPEVRAFEFYGM